MNTNQLATFLTLLQKRSYQKTAQDLHYSRSTAMDHINSLELELGTKL
ncbi:MAG TPA: LysR family transcriptional regulator, partial [Lachnospiraceae bacterium]|nr:LysR family transcriptional regulator [Lachnospiraceae bacterium]